MPNVQELIVARPAELGPCLEHIAGCGALGFDTEFVGEDSYHPELCLVQVATPERLYLIDPFSAGPLEAFWNLLIDPHRTVVVHAGREEVRLCELGGGKAPGNVFDVQIAAGLIGLTYPLGHAALVQQLLNRPVAKGETLTDWRRRPLTRHQIGYAYDDVRHLLDLHRRISNRLEKLGRTAWAREEFADLVRRVRVENPESERWRKLRGLGGLDRRKLAAVRELFAWRDEIAAKGNRPARTVLRDDLLVEIARRNPKTPADFQVLRGLPRLDFEAVLGAVERARALPADLLPIPAERDNDPPQVGWVTGILMAALGDFCARWDLSSSLVASTADVKLLVRARLPDGPAPTGSSLTRGWRAVHVRPHLDALLDGRKALRVGSVADPAPFRYDDEQPADLPAGP
jgi:ribonuclease D